MQRKNNICLVLIVCLVASLIQPMRADAAFSIRKKAPEKSNEYYYSSKNPFYPDLAPGGKRMAGSLGNCTWYAYGRAYEVLGEDPGLSKADAGKWYGNNEGFNRKQKPEAGAIACWSSGAYGHVAFVEKVNGDGTIYITESSYKYKDKYGNSHKGWEFKKVTKVNPKKYMSGFKGYIYLRPLAPAFQASSATENAVTVKWKKVHCAKNYLVYRSTSSSKGYKLVATVSGNGDSFKDKNLSSGMTYYYRIYAQNNVGKSGLGKSSQISIKTKDTAKATDTTYTNETELIDSVEVMD